MAFRAYVPPLWKGLCYKMLDCICDSMPIPRHVMTTHQAPSLDHACFACYSDLLYIKKLVRAHFYSIVVSNHVMSFICANICMCRRPIDHSIHLLPIRLLKHISSGVMHHHETWASVYSFEHLCGFITHGSQVISF
jgi:hypothetical protein